MRQQQANQNVSVTETETRQIAIGGEQVPFEFSKGTSNGKDVRMVSGVVRGKRGPVMLQLVVPEAQYDEAAVIQMLESIK